MRNRDTWKCGLLSNLGTFVFYKDLYPIRMIAYNCYASIAGIYAIISRTNYNNVV